jgi:hypothetical protein
LTGDSKTRISIYGSSKVAKKLAEFLRDYSETISEDGAKSYARLIQAMREDTINVDENLSEKEIEQILFANPRVSKRSSFAKR